jgi:hypothetical protein
LATVEQVNVSSYEFPSRLGLNKVSYCTTTTHPKEQLQTATIHFSFLTTMKQQFSHYECIRRATEHGSGLFCQHHGGRR